MSLLTKSVFHISQNAYNVPFVNNVYKYLGPSVVINQIRNYAARKGTREKRKKQKVKVEEKKTEFIPHSQRDRERLMLTRPKRRLDDSWKKLPTDNVYPQKYYQWKIYDFVEAVECHRETHHPEMYNQPRANLHVAIELNMIGEKKTRFLENFNKIAPVKYKFDHGEERSVLAFSKDAAVLEEAQNAGALLVGGADTIKEIQNGNISIHDFQFILAHPDILPELVALRGLLKKKFPNARNGTLEVELGKAVDLIKTGIQFTSKKDEYEKDFGLIETVIGTLDMEPKHLEENFASLINSVNTFKPKRAGSFITRCLLWSPPSREKLKINHNLYIKQAEQKPKKTSNEDVEEEEEKQLQSSVVA